MNIGRQEPFIPGDANGVLRDPIASTRSCHGIGPRSEPFGPEYGFCFPVTMVIRQDAGGDARRWSMKVLGIVIAALLLVGCRSNQKLSSEAEESEKPLSAHGATEGTQSASKANVLQGKVLERLDAGRYSYLRLSTSSGEIWAAVLLTEAKVGSEVTIENPMPMDGFQTKTLNR